MWIKVFFLLLFEPLPYQSDSTIGASAKRLEPYIKGCQRTKKDPSKELATPYPMLSALLAIMQIECGTFRKQVSFCLKEHYWASNIRMPRCKKMYSKSKTDDNGNF